MGICFGTGVGGKKRTPTQEQIEKAVKLKKSLETIALSTTQQIHIIDNRIREFKSKASSDASNTEHQLSKAAIKANLRQKIMCMNRYNQLQQFITNQDGLIARLNIQESNAELYSQMQSFNKHSQNTRIDPDVAEDVAEKFSEHVADQDEFGNGLAQAMNSSLGTDSIVDEDELDAEAEALLNGDRFDSVLSSIPPVPSSDEAIEIRQRPQRRQRERERNEEEMALLQ
jgi:hypothetical protein